MITKLHPYIVCAIFVTMLAMSTVLAWQDSLTFDEIAHIPAGYSYVTQFDYRLNPEHPPLLKVLAGMALLPINPHFDTTQLFWTTANSYGEYGQWDAGKHFLHHAGNDTDILTFFARMPFVLISSFFALFLFYWGKRIGGIITGLFAMILYAFDPNVFGHNHLVTTDVGIAIAIGIAFFFFLQFLKNPTWLHVIYGGVALGIAQITKFSAILLIPFFGILLIIYPFIVIRSQDQKRSAIFFKYILRGTCAVVIMFFVIWAAYIPVTYRMPENVLPSIVHIKGQPEKYPRDKYFIQFIIAANENHITRPLATYAQGLMQVLSRVDDGNATYFFGSVSSDASRWYFPFVFVTKQTVIHLLFYVIAGTLGALGILRTVRAAGMQSFVISMRRMRLFALRHFHEIVLGSFVALYIYISISGNLTIGFRHLFPMMPLLYVLTAKTIVDSYKKIYDTKKKKIIRALFIFTICALIFTTLTAFPHYISYFNILCGGSKNGYKYVTDSNADWGQDLKRLSSYLAEHQEIETIRINYFGGDDVTNRIGEKRYIPWWDSKRPVEPGYYAISALFLQESIYRTDRADDDSYRWTQKLRPFAQIGTSILIYKVD